MKLTLILLKVRKSTSRTISILILANKNVFSKNRNFSSLLFNEKKQLSYQRSLTYYFQSFKYLLNMKTKFFCKTLLHYIDLTTKINESFNQMLIKLGRIIDIKNLLKLNNRLIKNCSRIDFHTSYSH